MAELIAKRSRFNITVSIDVMPIGMIYNVGDIIGLDDDTHGWINKPFRVKDKVIIDDGLVSLIFSRT